MFRHKNPAELFRVFTIIFLVLVRTIHAQPVKDITFAAFDLETTGLDAKTERVIEIAVVKFRNGKILDSRSWLINPEIPIPEASRRIHGITDAMVAREPSFKKIFPKFIAFTEGAVLLAHNSRFDLRMLSAEAERNGLDQPLKGDDVLNTLKLARTLFPDAGSYSMEKLAEYFGFESKTFHRALADAHHARELFSRCLAVLPPETTLADLRQYTKPKQGTTVKMPSFNVLRNDAPVQEAPLRQNLR